VPDLPRKLGERVRELRKARGLSREEVAEALHVDPVSVARIERGQHFPARHLEGLADALAVDLPELFRFGEPVQAGDLKTISQLARVAARRNPKLPGRIVRLIRILLEP
jgi:transcriptional regulator with XRE-family HTH domain